MFDLFYEIILQRAKCPDCGKWVKPGALELTDSVYFEIREFICPKCNKRFLRKKEDNWLYWHKIFE